MNLFTPLAAKALGGLAVVLLIVAGVQTIRVEHLKRVVAVLRIDLVKVKEERDREQRNHQATKKAYTDAQAEAERMEVDRLARITAQQERINNDRLASYNRRLADARADYNRLRSQAGAGAIGAPGCQPMPVADRTPGTVGAACDNELSYDERLIATKQAIQLDELITVIEQHRAIPVN